MLLSARAVTNRSCLAGVKYCHLEDACSNRQLIKLRRRPQIQILLAPLNSCGTEADTYAHLAHIFSARTHTKAIAGVLPRAHKRSHVFTCSLPAVSWDIMLPNRYIHHMLILYAASQSRRTAHFNIISRPHCGYPDVLDLSHQCLVKIVTPLADSCH